jgi:hypothetical protein
VCSVGTAREFVDKKTDKYQAYVVDRITEYRQLVTKENFFKIFYIKND